VAASLTQANSIADAQEGRTNSLAHAEATFVLSSAAAGTQEAKAISAAGAQLLIGQVQGAMSFLSALSSAATSWTNSIANATFAAATAGESTSEATLNAANAWRQFSLDGAGAESTSAGSEMSALLSFVTTTIMAAKAESDTKADAAEARIVAEVGNALTATADEAAAATTATKSVAGAQSLAAGASVLAGQIFALAAAGAGKLFADANIAAALEASNDAVDAVHTYVVASIGVNLIASTAATGFALLRENSAISAMTTAQKSAINATHTATLANLSDDLTGRNASEALDDPIAIAAAGNAAAAANKAAWETVRNLQARAAITFAGTGPGAGGFAMGFAGFTGWVGDQFDVVWAGGVGLAHGLAIVGNSLTVGYFGSLDSYVDGLIEDNGGMYGASEKFANLGTFALLLAGGYAAAGAASTVSATFNIPMGFAFFSEGGALAIGATGTPQQVRRPRFPPHSISPWGLRSSRKAARLQ
jgi:hypothetical protein